MTLPTSSSEICCRVCLTACNWETGGFLAQYVAEMNAWEVSDTNLQVQNSRHQVGYPQLSAGQLWHPPERSNCNPSSFNIPLLLKLACTSRKSQVYWTRGLPGRLPPTNGEPKFRSSTSASPEVEFFLKDRISLRSLKRISHDWAPM